LLSSDSEIFNIKYSNKIDRDKLDEPFSPMKKRSPSPMKMPEIKVKDLNEAKKGPKLNSDRSGHLKFSKDEI